MNVVTAKKTILQERKEIEEEEKKLLKRKTENQKRCEHKETSYKLWFNPAKHGGYPGYIQCNDCGKRIT
jgi:hypothetical protein